MEMTELISKIRFLIAKMMEMTELISKIRFLIAKMMEMTELISKVISALICLRYYFFSI